MIAVLRSGNRLGNQVTGREPRGTSLAVRSLMIGLPVVVSGMGVRSWFGFQVWFRFAGVPGFQELGEG